MKLKKTLKFAKKNIETQKLQRNQKFGKIPHEKEKK